MPAIPLAIPLGYWIVGGGGLGLGYLFGKGTESVAGIVKWSAIGVGLFVAARALKVL